MGSRIRLCLFLLAINFLISPGGANFELIVGGNDGWVTNPSESYASWAGRLRFSVNDTLVFLYDKSVDSVVEVTSADYTSCNAANPITRVATGRDTFKLSRSGPFFFISGNASHCQAGQKVIVVVLAIRSPPAITPTPSATTPAPASAPQTAAPAPATTTTPAPGSAPISAPTAAPTPSPSASPSAPALAPTSSTSPPSESAPVSSATAGPAGSPGPSPASPDSESSSASTHTAPRSSATVLMTAVMAVFGSALLV